MTAPNSHLPLNSDDLTEVTRIFHRLKRGDSLTQPDLDELVRYWEPKIHPDIKDRSENFVITRPDASTTGVVGPRWIFHLLGLRHRAVEIGFHTESGLIVLQRRSATKTDWPDMPDMAVAGHIPQNPDGSDISFEEGARKEIEEEMGLAQTDEVANLGEGRLQLVGMPYNSLDMQEQRNPPYYNAEVRQIFGGTLTGLALSRIRFTDNEVSGILLVTLESAWDMLARHEIASGMRYSLPRYLDWLELQRRM